MARRSIRWTCPRRRSCCTRCRSGSGTITALAPGWLYAYVAPASGTGGALLNIAAGTEQMLQGAVSDVAFSGDGATVAWVDASRSPAHLFTEPVTQSAPAWSRSPNSAARPVTSRSISGGDEVAYLSTHTSGDHRTRGRPVAERYAACHPAGVESDPVVASPQVAIRSHSSRTRMVRSLMEQATVPGARDERRGPLIPGRELDAARFVEAQVG